MTRSLTIVLLFVVSAFAQRKDGSPLDHLPKNVEQLTYFGERADFSPDNQTIAFMNKSFGDAFALNLKDRRIRCLTCNVPGTAFLRVMHLTSGDYLLIGPECFSDLRTSRQRDNELWFLSKQSGSKPVRIGQKVSEGAAISKKTLKIGFSMVQAQDPSLKPEQIREYTQQVWVPAFRRRCRVIRRRRASDQQEDGVREPEQRLPHRAPRLLR